MRYFIIFYLKVYSVSLTGSICTAYFKEDGIFSAFKAKEMSLDTTKREKNVSNVKCQQQTHPHKYFPFSQYVDPSFIFHLKLVLQAQKLLCFVRKEHEFSHKDAKFRG